MDPLVSLSLANVAFILAHFVLSHPLRAGLVGVLGDRGFLGLYSLINLALFWWIVQAFRAAGGGALAWNGAADLPWIVASVLTVLAMVLLVGSFKGNPALPETGAEVAEKAQAAGVFAVTRHPMMWGIALWALAHVIAWPSPRTLITAGAMAFLALVGARLQDGKKRKLMGEAWQQWELRTSYWPRVGGIAAIPLLTWLVAVAGWLALTWVHVWLAGIAAGAWRWIG